jgi:hypothetical protein
VFQNLANTCWNLTLNASAAPAEICTCWTSPELAAAVTTFKSCDSKFHCMFYLKGLCHEMYGAFSGMHMDKSIHLKEG